MAAELEFEEGEQIVFRARADGPEEIHVHGYDIEQELKPGATTEMTFTARATGRFTVEPHIGKTPSGGHAHGDVLVTIEVYP